MTRQCLYYLVQSIYFILYKRKNLPIKISWEVEEKVLKSPYIVLLFLSFFFFLPLCKMQGPASPLLYNPCSITPWTNPKINITYNYPFFGRQRLGIGRGIGGSRGSSHHYSPITDFNLYELLGIDATSETSEIKVIWILHSIYLYFMLYKNFRVCSFSAWVEKLCYIRWEN